MLTTAGIRDSQVILQKRMSKENLLINSTTGINCNVPLKQIS